MRQKRPFVDYPGHGDGVVKIYGTMKPDAAAERLAELKSDLAAAILMKLDQRKAGTILNEMKADKAATLTAVMAPATGKTSAQPRAHPGWLLGRPTTIPGYIPA